MVRIEIENGPRFNLLIMFLCLVAVVFIGITDFVTGFYLSFSIFFLIPIMIGAWIMGRIPGIVLSFASAAAWLISDLMSGPNYQNFLIPYWNAFVRMCFFLISSYLLAYVRMLLDREKTLSRTDPLTGINNARSFYDLVEREIDRARRHKGSFSVAYCDVDNFKTVNDTLGHSTGDRLLSLVADIISDDLRTVDIVARLGGDEFAVFLADTDENNAANVIERVRSKLLEAMKRNNWPVTFSIGIATFNIPPNSVNDMIKTADALMYEVKNGGKNRIKSKTF